MAEPPPSPSPSICVVAVVIVVIVIIITTSSFVIQHHFLYPSKRPQKNQFLVIPSTCKLGSPSPSFMWC